MNSLAGYATRVQRFLSKYSESVFCLVNGVECEILQGVLCLLASKARLLMSMPETQPDGMAFYLFIYAFAQKHIFSFLYAVKKII